MQHHQIREIIPDPPPRCLLEELSIDWPVELRLAASSYIAQHSLHPPALLRVDVVLMLLRIGGEEALRRAGELAGKPITHCPSAVPPWPPKPVVKRQRALVVVQVAPNTCAPTTDMHRRYGMVKIGMTRDQLLARGVTPRDLRVWKDRVSFKERNIANGQST